MGRRERLIQAKWATLIEHASRAGLKTFVETGTFRGDTIAHLLPLFDELITIELDAAAWKRSKSRFADESKVTCLLGDSRSVLPEVLQSLTSPALFWLDAHYFGGKLDRGPVNIPIVEEVAAISSHSIADRHVIVIDDAKVFLDWKNRTDEFPTYQQIADTVLSRHPDWYVQSRMIHEETRSRVIEAYNANHATAR